MKVLSVVRTVGIVAVLMTGFAHLSSAEPMKLKLGNEGSYPPFSIITTEGKLSGMEPDLAREMCKRMEAECDIVTMDFKALLPSLISGKIDMIVSQLTPLPERLEKTEFTTPILLAPDSFIVSKEWYKGYDAAAFKGIKVAVQRGSSHAKYLKEHWPEADPVYYENPDQQQLDLLAGRVAAVFGAKLIWAMNLIAKPEGKDFKLSEEDFWVAGEVVGNSWALQKGQFDLLEKVNMAITSMVADCTYTKIRKKYLPIQTLAEEPAKCM